MYAVRRWAVRHSRMLEGIYDAYERGLVALHPLWNAIGYERLDRPVAAVERVVKGFLFDCQMCGQCVLGDTGMSCPMNCPKQLRNGPCGGVRANGNCEVKPDMRCVWVEAYEGSRHMRAGANIANVQVAVDFSRSGHSAWLRSAREQHERRAALEESKA